ncbi:MAG: NHL repeat-containing protein [Candidatus Eisenbacteria bacterium]|nr:NHL repeat-containing protein [Candidatus Eisenbacteria bacterium]
MKPDSALFLLALISLGLSDTSYGAALEPPPTYRTEWSTVQNREVFGMVSLAQGGLCDVTGSPAINVRSPDGALVGWASAVTRDTMGWIMDIAAMPNGRVFGVGITVGDSDDRLWEFNTLSHTANFRRVAGMPRLTTVAALDDSTLLLVGSSKVFAVSPAGMVRGPWGPPINVASDIAVGPQGIVVISDQSSKRIHVCNRLGLLLAQWGGEGSGEGQFQGGYQQVAVDGAGNIYVADIGNDRVQKFRTDGTFVCQWGTDPNFPSLRLSSPQGICVNAAGSIVAVSSTIPGGRVIKVFDNASAVPASRSTWGGVKTAHR